MKNLIKQTVCAALIIALIVATMPSFVMAASAGDKSGTYSQFAWTLDSATGTLTISGEGYLDAPFGFYGHDLDEKVVKTIIFQNGITSIYPLAFELYSALETVVIPDSMESIGSEYANHANLQSITIPANTTLLDGSFLGCPKLTITCYPGSLAHIYAQKTNTPFKLLDTVKPPVAPGLAAALDSVSGYETISAGNEHTMVIKADNTLWATGKNTMGQLGNGKGGAKTSEEFFDKNLYSTEFIKIMDDVVSVTTLHYGNADDGNTFVIKTDGSLWGWGDNYYGQLGIGTSGGSTSQYPSFQFDEGIDQRSPVRILDNVVSVSSSYFATYAIKADGSLWGWGYDRFGEEQLRYELFPIKIMDNVLKVSTAGHVLIIKSDNSLWDWGSNVFGELGDGTTQNHYIPAKIMDNVISISTGTQHSAALKSDGSLWVWGMNSANGKVGTLGIGSATIKSQLTPVKIMDNVTVVNTSHRHTLAVKTDGTLWAWGENLIGEIGDGTSGQVRMSPVKIMDDVLYASAGGQHSAALKKDGSLWLWGSGDYGQLGDGTWITPDAQGVRATYKLTKPVKIMDGVKLPGVAATPKPAPPVLPNETHYLAGTDPAATAISIAKQGWTSADTVIIAPGAANNLVDALAVAPLAGQEKAPILYTLGDTVTAALQTEITRLGAQKIITVGAVSDAFQQDLQAKLPNIGIEILRGQTRRETAALINAKVTAPKGTFIIGYNAVPDAVSAASFAAANGYIIQLAEADGSFNGDTSKGGYILGGPTLVKDIPGLSRLYGADRYATNLKLRESLTFGENKVYVANGQTLAEALAAAPLAAKDNAFVIIRPDVDDNNFKVDTKAVVYKLKSDK